MDAAEDEDAVLEAAGAVHRRRTPPKRKGKKTAEKTAKAAKEEFTYVWFDDCHVANLKNFRLQSRGFPDAFRNI